jgi:hypothetical protein
MRRILTLGLIAIGVSISGCTFNVSTGTGNADAPASNTTAANTANSAPTTTSQPANAAAPKKEEAAPAPKAESPSSPANVVRIKFANGETSTTMTKDIPANSSVEFLMYVQKGQTISYTAGYDFDDSDLQVFMTEPGLIVDSQVSGPKEPNEFLVKKSGDHTVTVKNVTKKKVTMTLYLDIE